MLYLSLEYRIIVRIIFRDANIWKAVPITGTHHGEVTTLGSHYISQINPVYRYSRIIVQN